MQEMSALVYYALYRTAEQKATSPVTYGNKHDVVP